MKQQAMSQVTRPYATLHPRTFTSRSYVATGQRLDDTTTIRYAITACLVTFVLLASTVGFASNKAHSPRYCNPAVSKPCGESCILLQKNCTIPWTTSLAGVRAKIAKITTRPVYVETKPE